MRTLSEFLTQLGWDVTELSRQAGINYRTAKKAVDGDEIAPRSARDIAAALGKATQTAVLVGDVRGLIIGRAGIDTTQIT